MTVRKSLCMVLAWAISLAAVTAQDAAFAGNLQAVPFSGLSDRTLAALGQTALAIRQTEWKHAETANFVYHYFSDFVAAPVAVEAEFYYRVIAKDLQKDTSQWERKCHIFIFEKPEDWASFQTRASLDPWTGGIHSGSELFIQRNPAYKFKGNTLGHEIAHLVLHRFFGPGVPLWLNEGYAEYISIVAYASFHRARGYVAKPRANSVAPEAFVPVNDLITRITYPVAVNDVGAFYDQSQKLVRFFEAADKQKFLEFLENLSKGNQFDTALRKAYSAQFPDIVRLEREFKAYAVKDFGVALQE